MSPEGELVTGLSNVCGDGCPFSVPPMDDLQDPHSSSCCPSAPVDLHSQPSPQSSHWAVGSPSSCHNDLCLPDSCFYQFHMCGGHFISGGPDCITASDGSSSSHEMQVEFRLSPSASPPSTAVLPSHFQTFGSLLHSSPVQQPHSLTQWRGKSNLSCTLHAFSLARLFLGFEETRTKSAFI